MLLNEIAGGSIGSYGVVAFEDTDTSLVVHTISIIGEPKNMQLAIGDAISSSLSVADSVTDYLAAEMDAQSFGPRVHDA